MDTTPKAAKTLSNCLVMNEWDQGALSAASTIHRSTVSLHLAGERPIRDDHLALYLPCLDRTEQRQLLAAWLQDVLPISVQDALLDPATGKLQEEVTTFAIGLTLEQQSQLHFWAKKIACDDDLAHIFAAITRKGGWKPSASL
jgi:hypothetical protein